VTYRFSYLASPHEEITMEPVAAKFIISPAKLHIQVSFVILTFPPTFTQIASFIAVSPIFLNAFLEMLCLGRR
jgi:hypothetical protein